MRVVRTQPRCLSCLRVPLSGSCACSMSLHGIQARQVVHAILRDASRSAILTSSVKACLGTLTAYLPLIIVIAAPTGIPPSHRRVVTCRIVLLILVNLLAAQVILLQVTPNSFQMRVMQDSIGTASGDASRSTMGIRIQIDPPIATLMMNIWMETSQKHHQ